MSLDETSELAALHAFLCELAEDRAAGRTHPVDHYVVRWPAHGAAIRREYAQLAEERDAAPAAGDAPATPRIGHYSVLRELGRGGQATVYLARDERLQRDVALKVLPRTFASAQQELRLQREATTAARLDDSGICPIYEVGNDGSHAFLAMRYVAGQTLAERCAAARATGPLPWRDVVTLFARLCDSLHRAHAAGVVHRDIKPGNVMLEPSGQPVLLDFGLAVDAESDGPLLTRSGDVFGTPAYLPPERLLGHARGQDPRGDLWAVGVCLHEALTLERPFAAPTLDGLYRAILTSEPPPLRSRLRGLPRDLEAVLATCLEKTPERRYQTAADLAADLRAVLAGEPIQARAPGPWRRLQRWHVRNAPLAIGLWALLLGLWVVIGVQRTMLREVELARAEADQLNDFLIEKMLLAATPDQARGREPTAGEVLDAAAGNVAATFAGPTRIAGMLHHVLGRAQRSIGRRAPAGAAFEQAFAIREQVLGADARETLQSRFERCRAWRDADRLADAEREIETILALQTARFGGVDDDTLNSRLERALLWMAQGRTADAARECAAVAELRQQTSGDGSRQHLEALHHHGRCLANLGRRAEAEPIVRAVLAGRRKLLGNDAVQVERSLSDLAALLHDLASFDGVDAKWAEAEAAYAESLALVRRIYPANHPSYATAVNNVATFWQDRAGDSKDPSEAKEFRSRAEAMFRESLGLREASDGPESSRVATVCNNLGMLLLQDRRFAESQPLLERALAIQTRLRGSEHLETLKVLQNLAFCHLHRDGPAAALPYFDDAVRRLEQNRDVDPQIAATMRGSWLRTVLATDDRERGLAVVDEFYLTLVQLRGAGSAEARQLAKRAAEALRQVDRAAQAAAWDERAAAR